MGEWPAISAALSPPGELTFWSYRISPGFPAVWPLAAPTEAVFYVYAAGFAHGVLSDGEYYTQPWARVHCRGDSLNLEILNAVPRKAGVQGVRPLKSAEITIIRDVLVVDEFAQALASDVLPRELVQRIRSYYLL